MLERLRGTQTRLLLPVARWLLRRGVRPAQVTWFGTLAVSLAAVLLLAQGHLMVGAVAIAVLSTSDMIDGHMAREAGTADAWGAFLDSSLDRIADGAMLGSLVFWSATSGQPGWVTGVGLVALVTAEATSYVRARAEAVGVRGDGGWVSRADRVALVVVGSLSAGLGLPHALAATFVVLALGGLQTVVVRMRRVRRQLRGVHEVG